MPWRTTPARPAARVRRGRELVRDGSARRVAGSDARARGGRRGAGSPPARSCRWWRGARPRARAEGDRARARARSPIASSREALDAAGPDLPFAVIGLGKLGAAGAELRLGPRRGVRLRGRGRGGAPPRRRSSPSGRSPASARPAGSPTRTCVPRAAADRSRARSPASSSTGSGTRTPGSSSRCSAPGSSRATRRSVGGSARSRPTSPTPSTCPSSASGEIRRMRERIERERVRPAEATQVPLQARLRVARRRAVRRRALAHALRRRAIPRCGPGGRSTRSSGWRRPGSSRTARRSRSARRSCSFRT